MMDPRRLKESNAICKVFLPVFSVTSLSKSLLSDIKAEIAIGVLKSLSIAK